MEIVCTPLFCEVVLNSMKLQSFCHNTDIQGLVKHFKVYPRALRVLNRRDQAEFLQEKTSRVKPGSALIWTCWLTGGELWGFFLTFVIKKWIYLHFNVTAAASRRGDDDLCWNQSLFMDCLLEGKFTDSKNVQRRVEKEKKGSNHSLSEEF